MGKKKGFTLIELLAVLVILATILAISMPKILDTRDGSKRKAFKNDVDEIQGIAQLEYNNTKEARYYTFKDGVQTNENGEADKLEFKGDNPSDGYLKIYPNGDVEYYLKNKDRTLCARKEVGDRKGQIVKCEISDVEDFKLNLKATTTTNSIRVTVTPKNGEQDVIINEYYYQLDDGKVISSNKASHLYENLKAEENGKLKDYVIKVKACTKRGKCEEGTITVKLKPINEIEYKFSPKDWSLEKTITFTYPEIKNVGGQSIGKNEISTDGGTTFKIYRESITVNKDTTIVARITDGTNSLKSTAITLSQFDHTAPTITNVTGNPDKWTNQNVTLTVNGAKDKGDNNVEPGSGLADAAYSFDGGATWQASASKTYKSNTSGIVIKVRDKLGNIYTHSSIAITKIDKTAPECVWSGDTNVAPNAWTNQNRSISVSCNDLGGSNCNVNTLNKSWLFNTGTTRTTDLSYEIKDNAGNVTVCSKTANVFVDKTPPSCINSGGSASWTNKDITLTGNCSDTGGSGCKGNVIRTISSDTNSTKESPGTVYDNVGNAKVCPSDQIVRIDKTLPTVLYNLGGGRAYESNQTIRVTGYDTNFSYMNVHVYKYNGNGYVYSSDKSVSNHTSSIYDVNLTSGKWIVYSQVYDKAGNRQNQSPDNGGGWYYQEYVIGKPNVYYRAWVLGTGTNPNTPGYSPTKESKKEFGKNSEIVGTTGQGRALDDFEMKSDDGGTKLSGKIHFKLHVEKCGDLKDDVTTCGANKRIEALKIWLDGDLADYYDVVYSVHVQKADWLGTTYNGNWTGSKGLCRRLEAVKVNIVPKSDTGNYINHSKAVYLDSYSGAATVCAPPDSSGSSSNAQTCRTERYCASWKVRYDISYHECKKFPSSYPWAYGPINCHYCSQISTRKLCS